MGRHFRWRQDKIDELWADNRFSITPSGRVQFKRYLENHEGKAIGDVWDDIKRINQVADERLRTRLTAEWVAASQGKKFGL